jgi:hypothetical protein
MTPNRVHMAGKPTVNALVEEDLPFGSITTTFTISP